MKLFYAPPSPFARKARIVARERNLMDRVEEIVANPFQDDPNLLAVNPAGLVPALVLDDGTPLLDSRLICQHLDAIADGPTLIPNQSGERWRVLNHGALGDLIMDFALSVVVETRRTDASPSATFIARKVAKIERCLAALPVTPDMATLTLGDINAATALAYLDFRLPDLDWRSLRPDLAPWHDAIEQRPAFIATQPADHIG
ncbi:glutathione S-transferase family protein [Magnetovibrio sp.]|uniref:glutathione S-transferase family protein n=1 Tax=Magnetovibrio sp. TaxID=2024836 RepID=UPI002F93634C